MYLQTKTITCYKILLTLLFPSSVLRMSIEIERKFLVNKDLWKAEKPVKSTAIRQGYLLSDPDKTIRVRVAGDQGYLAIKGKLQGFSRLEFEYEIPLGEANELLDHFSTDSVEKTRHYVYFQDKLWEVDEFKGANDGLLIAEIELNIVEEFFEKPDWVLEEVTTDTRYLNANLAKKPFKQW